MTVVDIFAEGFLDIPITPGIYAIKNVVDGKIYIGSSKNIRRRAYQHFNSLRRGYPRNPYLLKAWRKYGPEAFVFDVLELCSECDLLTREQHYVDTCEAPLYNIGRHVDRPMLNRKATDETRAKMRAAKAASTYSHPPEVRARMSAAIKAAHARNPQIQTEQWKENVRTAKAARNWQPTEEWLENTRRGIASRKRDYTPEQVAKQLATKARSPYIKTPEQKAKWHATRKANAKKMSQESIAKMIATRAANRQLKIADGLITPKQSKKAA